MTIALFICLWIVAGFLIAHLFGRVAAGDFHRRKFRGSHDGQFLNWRRRME